MRRFFSQMNPTVRGLLIVALIAGLVIALNLYVTLAALYAIAGIAFFLAIAFFVYLLWRDRRQEIATWPTHAKVAFYLGAFTIVFALGAYFVGHPTGLDALAFLLVLGISGFAMWRVWRDQHTYGY
jgi:ABC-type nickel/cobalt efflux system permease component RcnA